MRHSSGLQVYSLIRASRHAELKGALQRRWLFRPKKAAALGGVLVPSVVSLGVTGRATNSKARKQTDRLATRSPLVPNAQAEVYRNEEDHVLRSCLILFVLVTTSTRLYSRDGLSLTPIAISVPKGNFLPNPSALLIQELPYCELGYGPCGGQCSSEEGKKKWNCPPDALPCHHDGTLHMRGGGYVQATKEKSRT